MAQGVDVSLQRLGTDRLDLFHIHGVRPEQCALVADRFGPVAQRLKEQGKIRFLCLSERYIVDAAYKFGADHPAVATVTTGTANTEHLEQNVASMEQPTLPETDKRKIAELFGHIAEYA